MIASAMATAMAKAMAKAMAIAKPRGQPGPGYPDAGVALAAPP